MQIVSKVVFGHSSRSINTILGSYQFTNFGEIMIIHIRAFIGIRIEKVQALPSDTFLFENL